MVMLTKDTQYIRSLYLKRDQIKSFARYPLNLPFIHAAGGDCNQPWV